MVGAVSYRYCFALEIKLISSKLCYPDYSPCRLVNLFSQKYLLNANYVEGIMGIQRIIMHGLTFRQLKTVDT